MKTGEHTNVEDKLSEGVSKPPAKRPRLLKSEAGAELNENKDDAPAVVINVDAMVYVMEFLPPRSLYNIASTCKSLRSKVTTKMVVQSALTQGGRSRKIMEDLHELTKSHSIHVPSPLRLLRLANAKRCEFCNNKSKDIRNRFGLGVYACETCFDGDNPRSFHYVKDPSTGEYVRYFFDPNVHANLIEYSYPKKNHALMNHPRIRSCVCCWRRHRTDASGEMIGPLVTATDISYLNRVSARLQVAASSTVVNEPEHATASTGHDERIEDYLTNNLNLPAKEDYAEFNECVTSSIQMADRAKKERQERQLVKSKVAVRAKVPKVRKMMDEFIPLIDESLRECAMKRYEYEEFLERASLSTPLFSLRTKFLNDWLEPYIVKPGKMTKKARKEMSEKINLQLHRIKKLWEMDFLSDEDEFQSAAKAYFRKWFPTVEAIFTETSKRRTWYSNCIRRYGGDSRLDSNFLEFMEKGRYLGALCHLKDNDLRPVLLASEPTASCLREAAQHMDETSVENLVKKAWKVGSRKFDVDDGHDYGSYLLEREEDDSWIADAMDAGHKYLHTALTKFGEFALWLKGEVTDDVLRLAILNQMTKDYGARRVTYMRGVNVELQNKISSFFSTAL